MDLLKIIRFNAKDGLSSLLSNNRSSITPTRIGPDQRWKVNLLKYYLEIWWDSVCNKNLNEDLADVIELTRQWKLKKVQITEGEYEGRQGLVKYFINVSGITLVVVHLRSNDIVKVQHNQIVSILEFE